MANIENNRRDALFAALLLASMLLAGCAGTAGSRNVLKPLQDGSSLKRYSNLVLEAKSVPGVPIRPEEMNVMVALISHKIRQHELNHFDNVSDKPNDVPALQASLLFTRYEEGSSAARFMMAGFGQIHIDAKLALRDMETQELLAEYEVGKTFAWGGIYGASTTIKDVREGFVEAVVAALLELE